MNCRDCNKELGEKFIKYTRIVGTLCDESGVCVECAEANYNSYKKHDGKIRDFCEKCGEKFLQEDLSEIVIKKLKTIVCNRCREDLGR